MTDIEQAKLANFWCLAKDDIEKVVRNIDKRNSTLLELDQEHFLQQREKTNSIIKKLIEAFLVAEEMYGYSYIKGWEKLN